MPGGEPHVDKTGDNWLVYDGECPFCSAYVKLIRFRENVGALRLINARDGGPEVREIEAAELDLDEGMVLKLSGRLYHGQDCIHVLSLLTESSRPFGALNGWVFRSEKRAAAIYPVLRGGRNLALRLLGRRKINSA